MNEKMGVIGTVLLVGAMGISFFVAGQSSKSIDASTAQLNRVQLQNKQAKKKFDEKRDTVQKQAYADVKKETSPAIKQVLIHDKAVDSAKTVGKEFFNIFYNWKTQDEYMGRAKKLGSLADSSLLKNKDVFDDGKDSTGGNIIDTLKLSSKLSDVDITLSSIGEDGKASGVAEVKATQTSDVEPKSVKNTDKFYRFDFDTNSNKITALDAMSFLVDKNQNKDDK